MLIVAQNKLAALEKEQETAAPITTAPTVSPAAPADADAAKKRKIDLAIAKAGIKKAEKNIALLKEQGKNEAEIKASEWPQKLADAQDKLATLEKEQGANSDTATVKSAKPEPKQVEAKAESIATPEADVATQVKKQKIAAAMAKAQINKLTKRLESAPEDAEYIQQEIEATRQKQQDAEALLAQLTHSQDNT